MNIPPHCDVYAISRKDKPPIDFPSNVKWITTNSESSKEWMKIIDEVMPTALIHTSAMADIDQCEKEKPKAYYVNVELTKCLLEVCEKHSTKFLFCSSDTVFDGAKGMYKEEDIPIPLNYYAKTKVEAEKIVLNAKTSKVIARIALVMGFPVYPYASNSFMARMEQRIRECKSVPMPEDEYRTPIDVITLAKALIELAISSSYDGIIHLAGNDRVSRYEMANLICDEMNWDKKYIVPYIIDNPNRAPRPKDVSLDNRRAKKLLKTQFLGFHDELKRIKEIYLKSIQNNPK